MMSIGRSGVFTWTAPRTSSQWRVTSRQHVVEIGGAVARDQAARLGSIAASPRKKTNSALPPGGSVDGRPQRAARIEPGADAFGKRRRAGQRRPGWPACRCGR